MAKSKKAKDSKQFIYIVQASLELNSCKIGITGNLESRLNQYNNMTGKSNENVFKYLFACEVSDMALIENDLKTKFKHLRQIKRKEMYFFNDDLFSQYIAFIKNHKAFKEEILMNENKVQPKIKIIKKTTPSLKERGLNSKDLLQKAQKIQNDEFYTRSEDIESEFIFYDKTIWQDKVIFCNCDDAVGDREQNSSAFALYFIKNFVDLNIKKLICTHFSGVVDLFNQGSKGYIFTKDGFSEFKEYPPKYTGSFDHPLSLKILNDEADIVCTNPPFSKAKEYWDILIKSNKKFIIISNITNPITSSFIPYFYQKKVWAGYNRVDYYLNPKRELVDAAGHWYTNFEIINRPKYKNLKIVLLEEIPQKFKQYDDSNTLLVNNGYIPIDYEEDFAVSNRPILNGILEKGYELVSDKEYYPYKDGKKKFARVLIRKINKF